MKLIKINEEHYVIVDNSEIKEGDYCVGFAEGVNGVGRGWFVFFNNNSKLSKLNTLCENTYKITHSTQPLEEIVTENTFKNYEYISLQKVKELIGEVDVEKKAREEVERYMISTSSIDLKAKIQRFQGYMKGYNQAIEDNKDKKYTEEDLRKALEYGYERGKEGDFTSEQEENFYQSLQPKTEWEVEIVDDKLKLK